MHRCTMLEFEGKSYRLKEAAARIALHPAQVNKNRVILLEV